MEIDAFLNSEEEKGSQIDLQHLWRIFLRRKWLFLVPFILCLAVAGVAIKVMTPIYFSAGQIHVKHEATSAQVLPREVTRYSSRHIDREVYTNIQIILTGPRFLERLVREHKLHIPGMETITASLMPEEATLDEEEAARIRGVAYQLRQQIRVKSDDTHLFSIGVRNTDPERAYLLARIVLDRFLEEERASRVQPATSVLDFLQGQRQAYEKELSEAEGRLHEFQRTMVSGSLVGNPVNDLNLAGAENTLSRLRSQFFDAQTAELFQAERVARATLGQLPDLAVLQQDPDITNVVRELVSLEYERALGLQYASAGSPSSGNVGNLRVRLNSLIETRIARDFGQLGVMDRSKVSQYAYLKIYRDVRQGVINRLNQNIQDFKQFTTRQPEQSAQLSGLQQEVESAREMVQAIKRDITQENMGVEASMSEIGYKIVVRSDPKVPRAPIEPNKVKLAFMGFVLSLCMGGGLVVLAQILDRSFHSVQEIESGLGLKVIGTLPLVETEFFKRQRLRRVWTWTFLILAILLVASAGLLIVYPRII